MKTNIRLLLLIPLFYFILACEVDSNCDAIARDFIGFSVVGLNANLEEVPSNVEINYIRSPQADNVIFYDQDTLATFVLPLNRDLNELTYIFNRANDTSDTLTLGYDVFFAVDEPQECGLVFNIRNLKVLEHTLDSVVVVNDTINYLYEAPDIKLFFD